MVWDNLDPSAKQQVIELLDHPNIRAHTKNFGAHLISKPEYQRQIETDPNVDCYEYTFGGQTKRYSKELIINELFAHATIGQMMNRSEITKVQRDTIDRENFGLRSKTAIDLIDYITTASKPVNDLLKKTGLVNNQNYNKDKNVIRSTVVQLK